MIYGLSKENLTKRQILDLSCPSIGFPSMAFLEKKPETAGNDTANRSQCKWEKKDQPGLALGSILLYKRQPEPRGVLVTRTRVAGMHTRTRTPYQQSLNRSQYNLINHTEQQNIRKMLIDESCKCYVFCTSQLSQKSELM